MTMLEKIYRKDINEENVNTVGFYLNDEWRYQKEPIPITQIPIKSNNALVIGNGKTGHEFDLTKILPYRETTPWGEVGQWQYKRQISNFYTYGCNAIYRNLRPDFVIATGKNFINEIAASTYCSENVVYTNLKFLEQYPSKFHAIPQNPEFNSGAIAAYLAAFDGHKKVFMLGFDGIDTPGDIYNMYADTPNYPAKSAPINQEFWDRSLNSVMQVYSDTEFIRVCPTKDFVQPELWKYNLNYRQVDFRQFVVEADI